MINKKHLTWLIAGACSLGVALPMYAAAKPGQGGRPSIVDDNGVPGQLRGNCDEAEHVNDANCLAAGLLSNQSSTTGPTSASIAAAFAVVLPQSTASSLPDNSVPDNSAPGNSAPSNSVPDDSVSDDSTRGSLSPDPSVPTSVEDISGPCDEAEHVADPRCADGGTRRSESDSDSDSDDSGRGRGRGRSSDDQDDDQDDDSSGSGDDDSSDDQNDDSSGSGDDDSSDDQSDDSNSGSDDSDDSGSGHGSDD